MYANLASSSSKAKISSEREVNTKQPTLSESIARSAKYLPDSAQAKELNHTFIYIIVKDSMPISIVERPWPGFKHMLLKLNPRYQIPSRRRFTDYKIPQLYSHVKDNMVVESLKEVDFLLLQTCGVVIVDILTLHSLHFISTNRDFKIILP